MRVWWLGWRDFVAGRGFPFSFDRWMKVEQLNYEAGRLFAANIRAAGLSAPVWDGRGSGVGRIRSLCNKSVRAIGDPVP
jgi:hypothetical protein